MQIVTAWGKAKTNKQQKKTLLPWYKMKKFRAYTEWENIKDPNGTSGRTLLSILGIQQGLHEYPALTLRDQVVLPNKA